MTKRLRGLAIVAMATGLGVLPLMAARPPQGRAAGAGTTTLAEGLKEFQKRLDAYLELRAGLGRNLKPLSTTPSAAELSARQDALAAAIRAARSGVKQGNLVTPVVAAHITRIITADFRRRNPAVENAALKEVPRMPRPIINRSYPADAALPTVPPLLLSDLPQLPDNLQYRFFGRHVAILDGDVQIIIDFVADALPPH
jgi:hypothetical protein